MKKGFVIAAAMATMMVLTADFAKAQQYAFIDLVGDSAGGVQPARVQVGTEAGREGAAMGFGTLAQINIGCLGLFGFAEQSGLDGYQQQGAVADFSDHTFGGGVVARLIGVRRFTFGGFAQFGRYTSNVVATAPDSMGGIFQYRDKQTNFIATPGADIEYQVPRWGFTAFARIGHNFGNSIAATTANGVSFTGGVLVSVGKIGCGVKKAARLLP